MDIVVIGGTGTTGSYLVPRLVGGGHAVTVVSRGQRAPHRPHGAWDEVRHVELDRTEMDRDAFADRIASLEPDVVVDIVCYFEEEARSLVEALRGEVRHFLSTGTIWIYGPGTERPTPRTARRNPLGSYGERKAAIESYLLEEAQQSGFPATVIHPGHITAPNGPPISPEGTRDVAVFQRIADGADVTLPGSGTETLHHVHADDIARIFEHAIDNWNAAVGQSFHAVAPQAITTRGYAAWLADLFGSEPEIRFQPFDAWSDTVSDDKADVAAGHIRRSPHCSLDATKAELDFSPRFTVRETIEDAIRGMIDRGALDVSLPTGPTD